MIQTEFERYSLEATDEVRPIGDILPEVFARHGLLDSEPEIEAEMADAELISA